jgi:osmotically-inducible protein OsmY
MIRSKASTRAGMALLGALLLTQLQGCFVLGAAAVGGTALVVSDRRTSGSQLEDQTIQVKAGSRLGDILRGNGNVSVSSYNQKVLLTGQVPTVEYRNQIEQAVATITNVKAVLDEIVVGQNQTLSEQAGDTYLTSKVRAAFIDQKNLYSQALVITTVGGVVYLQGVVTQGEADLASSVASGVGGVKKVVTLFDVISPAQLQTQYQSTSKTPLEPPGTAASLPHAAP